MKLIIAGIAIVLIAAFVALGAGAPGYSIPPPSIATVAITTATITSETVTTSTITTLNISQALGTDLAPTLIEANWTHGAGWENPIVGPGLIKNADGTGTQTTTAATTIAAGSTYKVVITLSAQSVGSASYTLGGVTGGSSLAAATTYTDYITTTTTGKIIITPTNTSRFTISAISIKPVTGGLKGTTTNDLAPAGTVGEFFISSVTNANAVSIPMSTNVVDATSLVLTAGDWDVEGNLNFKLTSVTDTVLTGGLNTTSATLPVDGSECSSGVRVTTTSIVDSVSLPRKRITLAAGGTVYMSGTATFSAGSAAVYGVMSARRVR